MTKIVAHSNHTQGRSRSGLFVLSQPRTARLESFFMDTTLFDRLKQLNLPPQGFAIFGSGPLAIRGLIPLANDLDIVCRQEVWETVSSLGIIEYLPTYDVTVSTMFSGTVTFGTKWGIGDFVVEELIDTADIIVALPLVRLEHVIRYKQIRSSAKDLLHLDALQASGYFGGC